MSRDVSLYIWAHGRGGVLQGGGNSNVQRARSERITGIYRTRQSITQFKILSVRRTGE